ncbi:hypothetical protein NDK43_05435 [Neobacillus pocheonensis]|uniref:Uncharacterized protein n=1 Tax=Neobacillus pocheonensis TaxID=363869 RepID=A0ABT0W6H3_9BACI|nr:hypothetical protein [Neobacillus pocheonensis]
MPVEKYVLQKVKERKTDFEKALVKMKIMDTSEEETKLLTQKESLEKQLEKFDNRQKNLKIMRMDGEITKIDFLELSKENEEKINQVKQQMELIKIQLENLNNTDEQQQRLEQSIETLSRLEILEPQECNTFLKTFIKKIWFSTNAITNYNTKKDTPEVTIEIEWL